MMPFLVENCPSYGKVSGFAGFKQPLPQLQHSFTTAGTKYNENILNIFRLWKSYAEVMEKTIQNPWLLDFTTA